MKIFISILFLVSCLSQVPGHAQNTDKYHYNQVYDYSSEELVSYRFNANELRTLTKSYIGVPYAPEGKDPAGFDCSGFTFYIFKQFGIYLPYFSSQQGEIGEQIMLEDAQPGDLIFFTGSNQYSSEIGHVGIIVSTKDEKLSWVHATISKGVRMDGMSNTYYKARFLGIRRVYE